MRGSWSLCHQSTMAAMPVTRSSGLGVGDTRMRDMYSEYADTVSANEEPSKIKARLAALSIYAESQCLTGQAAFDRLRSLCSELQAELSVRGRFTDGCGIGFGFFEGNVQRGSLNFLFMDMRNFSIFYGFVFFICREQGQKSISVSTAINAWRLALTGRFRLLDQWCAFIQIHQRHAISEDTWRQVLEFSRSVHEDLSNYDPEGAWPVLVDEFVDNMYRKNSCSRCCTDTLCICTCEMDAMTMQSSNNFPGSSLDCRTSTLPGIAAQAGSKRRWKDPSEEAAQAESVNCLSQRLAKMPSPLSTKRMRLSGNVLAEVSDPMEGIDADVQQGQDSWEQTDTDNGTNQFAHGSIMGQDPPSPTSTSGDDVFLSPSWQPWPSQGRTETHQWDHFHGSYNVQKAETPAACGGYPAFSSPHQDLLLQE